MFGQPLPQSRRRRLFRRQLAAVHKVTPDGAIRMAVHIGIGKTHRGAIIQLHAPRSLYLQEERVDGAVHPHDLAACQRPAISQLRTVRVRRDVLSLQSPANALALQCRIQIAQFHADQIVRHCI